MTFARMDNLLETCKKHLGETGTHNTEIANYLVGYLLLRMTAEFELCFRRICVARAELSGDPELVNVVSDWAYIKRARMKISDLAGNIAILGPKYAAAFKAFKDDPQNAPVIVAWDNIHTNRGSVAHGNGAALSMADLEAFYSHSQQVLTAVAESLSLTKADIAALSW